jgi:uncharacterized protein (DUF1810 family)
MSVNDQYNLNRFITAQEPVYENVCRELAAGRKSSHWIWYVFPQLKGLGRSSNSEYYGLASLDEARAYLNHPVLGPRMIHCTELVNNTIGRTIDEVLGPVDKLKFHSSMTLFALAAPEQPVFKEALRKYFDGELDEITLELIDEGRPYGRSFRTPTTERPLP